MIYFTDEKIFTSSIPIYLLPRDADRTDLTELGFAQLNLMSLHLILVWQLPII